MSMAGRGQREPAHQMHLGKQISWSIIGQVGYVLSQMAILAVLSWFRGAEAVGEFGLALAMTTPLFMFVNMGGKTSQSSDVTQRYSFAEYGALVGILALLAFIATVLIGLFYVDQPGTFAIMVIVGLTKVVESFSNLSYGAYQQAGRTDRVASSLLLRGALTLPCFAAFLALGFATGPAFLAQLVVWLAMAAFRDYPAASRIASGRLVLPRADRARLLKLVGETFPIGASYFVNSLLVSLPRMFVERSLGLAPLGLLTVVGYFQQAGTLVASAAGQALVNKFARLRLARDGHAMRRVVLVLASLATIISVTGVAFVHFLGEFFLGLLFGPEFRGAHGLLVLVAIAVCTKLYGVIPQSVMHADRRYKTFLAYEIASVAVSVIGLFLLVPRFGLIGAGYVIMGVALFRLAILTAATLVRPGGQDVTAPQAGTLTPEARP